MVNSRERTQILFQEALGCHVVAHTSNPNTEILGQEYEDQHGYSVWPCCKTTKYKKKALQDEKHPPFIGIHPIFTNLF